MADLELIHNLYPFNKMDNKSFNRILSLFKINTYRKGKYLTYQGDRTESLFFILKGRVACYKWVNSHKEKFIKEAGLGSWIGVSETLLETPCFFDVKSLSDVSTLTIPSKGLNQLLENREISEALFYNLAEWNQFFSSQLREKSCLTTLEEFISTENEEIIEITQDQLSVKLGFTRESINRNLKKLEEKGQIRVERSRIIKTHG